MAVRSKNVHWKLSEIRPCSWDAIARLGGLDDGTDLLAEIAEAAPRAVEAVNGTLPAGFPSEIRDRVFEGFLSSVKAL
jgi:hypothetical protein